MNEFLKNALAGRKKMVDETSSTSAIGQGLGSIADDKPTTSKLPFYTGDMVDKSETGFTGLLNQGATCYLNSLIQSLFMTPELREAVFEWRYDSNKDAEEKRCIPLQLQRLFASLQISIRGAVRTKDLTTSFGWTGREIYQQHDVLELFNVLFENLESQAFGTKLSMVVSDLHRGSYKDYVQCLKCKTMRGRNIPFVGLGLDITNALSFEQAMKQYITPEILDGGNKVTCSKCDSKQDSKKGIRLTALPYFLGIHLKRWTFNFHTLQRIKLNKKISFPRKFNGAQYLNCNGDDNDNDKNKNNENEEDNDEALEYELYSMMIHTGGASGGHYFAYIKDFETGKWLKFNDSNVEEISIQQIEDWFNPPPTIKNEEEENDKKDDNDNDKTAPSPAPIPESKPIKGDGMDIAAAIAANLKDKRLKKDIKQKLEENKKKIPKMLDPFGAAYMLMFRLIDDKRNVIKISDHLIPENIRNEIKKNDEIYSSQKNEYDRLRQYITLKIHFDGKVFDVMVKKKESMKIALNTIYNELKLQELDIINCECIRVRNMKVTMNIPLEPYDNNLDDLIESFCFHDPKHLILETKGENELFPHYEKEKISLRMIELNDITMEWKKEVLIQIDCDSKIGELRKIIADKLLISDFNRIRIAYLNEGLAFLLHDDTKRIKADCRILDGHYIHIEICKEGEKHIEGKSKLMDKFDEQLNTLHLLYNELYFDETVDNIYTLALDIDIRSSVGKLREILAIKCNININELVLRKGWHQQELKDNNKTLQQYGLHTNCQVFIEKGKPLKTTQYLFQIFIEDEVYIKKKEEKERKKWDEYLRQEIEKEKELKSNKNTIPNTIKSTICNDDNLGEAFLFVGDCILDERWKMNVVKQEICKNIANVPHVNKMRIRSFNDHNRLIKVYLDTLTLKGNLKKAIKDYTQICCQKTIKENEEFTEDKILLYIARWYPQKMDFGPQIEYAFNKKTAIKSQLRLELSKFSGIPIEYIRCSHPRAYYLNNPENRRKICILDWENNKCTDNTTLTSKQWKCKSGEFILFKDNREPEKLTKEDFETASITSIIGQRREEALIFYTPQQQIEREKQLKIEKKEKEKQEKQAQKDAIQRMKETQIKYAKNAQKSMEKSMEKSINNNND